MFSLATSLFGGLGTRLAVPVCKKGVRTTAANEVYLNIFNAAKCVLICTIRVLT